MIDFIHTEPWRSKTFLEEKYVKNGRSIAQIAAETLSSRSAVRDALIEFGIPLKQQGKPGLRPAQVPYGYRRSDGLLVPHLGEQRVIQSVKKMSSDGLSYRQICDFLTSVGVPTKNQGKGWQPEMIRRVLTRWGQRYSFYGEAATSRLGNELTLDSELLSPAGVPAITSPSTTKK